MPVLVASDMHFDHVVGESHSQGLDPRTEDQTVATLDGEGQGSGETGDPSFGLSQQPLDRLALEFLVGLCPNEFVFGKFPDHLAGLEERLVLAVAEAGEYTFVDTHKSPRPRSSEQSRRAVLIELEGFLSARPVR